MHTEIERPTLSWAAWLTVRLFFFLGLALPCFSQNASVSFEDARFDRKEKSRKKALKNIRLGDGILEIDADYKAAAKVYQRAEKFNPNNSLLNFKIGLCYYRMPEPDFVVASLYFQKAFDLRPWGDSKVPYYLGRCYHYQSKWDSAQLFYRAYLTSLPEGEDAEKKKTEKLIQECGYGKQLSSNPKRVIYLNLGRSINSSYPEFGPVISSDERYMFFTASRKTTTGYEMAEDGWYVSDIYMAQFRANRWSRTKKIEGINTAGHESIVNVAAKDQRLLIYRGAENGSLYSSTLKGNKVGKPQKLPSVFNSSSRETSAVLSSDLKTIYFTSDRKGSLGGLDIWKSTRLANGKWSEPENLGEAVNSPYDEDGLFLSSDDQVLYFSSKGHTSIGGFDFFKTTQKDGKWRTAENLGYPINTPADEVYLSVSNNGKELYYGISDHFDHIENRGGSDLYKVTIIGEEKKPLLAPVPLLSSKEASKKGIWQLGDELMVYSSDLTILKGVVRDSISGKPMLAMLSLSDNSNSKLVSKFISNPNSGEFTITLPSEKDYGLAVTATGYLLHSENFNTSKNLGGEITLDISMKKAEAGSQIRLNNIFFDTGKASLRQASQSELNHVIDLMKENPKLQIEIIGHTDNTGNHWTNQELSVQRARSVVNYLVEKGADRRKLTFKGYGDTKPIASNDSEEGRQQNRRTELRIVGN